MDKRDLVMSFHSTHQAILAEKLVKILSLNYDMIPTPRKISAGCGLSLELASMEADRWLGTLTEHRVVWGGIYYRQGQDFLPWSPQKSP